MIVVIHSSFYFIPLRNSAPNSFTSVVFYHGVSQSTAQSDTEVNKKAECTTTFRFSIQ